MRRIIPLILGALLVISIGLFATFVFAMRRNSVDEHAIPVVTSKFSCTETPTTQTFEQFWATFHAATQKDDKETLFALTSRCDFGWWWAYARGVRLRPRYYFDAIAAGQLPEPGLEVMGGDSHLVFETQQDFFDNYSAIFSQESKQHILNGTPAQTADGLYCVSWRDVWLKHLCFNRLDGVGYKFTGSDWEP
jgi:hypothetical protein